MDFLVTVLSLEKSSDFFRMSALFHDIGKLHVYQKDENGIGHFFGYWDKINKKYNG